MQSLRHRLKNFDLTSVFELLPMLRNLWNLHLSSSLPQFAVIVNNPKRLENNSFDKRICETYTEKLFRPLYYVTKNKNIVLFGLLRVFQF